MRRAKLLLDRFVLLGRRPHVRTHALEFAFQVRKPSILVGFGQRRQGRRRAPIHREAAPVVEQDQERLSTARSRERNYLDADLAHIETDVAA